ncbi:MAG: radical SAM protein [Desulfobacterales bacterium]
MKILLISANTEKISMPALPMGLGFVAEAVQHAGHAVRFLDLMGTEAPHEMTENVLKAFQADVIGISIRNVDDQASAAPRFLLREAAELVSLCRKFSSAPIVLGGAGYSLFPEAMLDYLDADMGIQGEGEAAFAELVRRMETQKTLSGIPGLYIRGKGLQAPRVCIPPDQWSFPDPNLFDPALSQNPAYYLPFHTRRGCPMKCSYCATSVIEGNLIRKCAAPSAVRELKKWREAGFSRIFFTDNTFNLPPSHAQQFCELLAAEISDLHWRCILYPGYVTQNLAKVMAKSGCREVSLGFESGSDPVLRGMRKRFASKDIRESAQILTDAGIKFMGFLLLGGPDETRESVLESLEFADSLKPESMKLTVGIRIYPHTRVAEIARAESAITAEDNLLFPKFYIKSGMEDWLRETVSQWLADRPNWLG